MKFISAYLLLLCTLSSGAAQAGCAEGWVKRIGRIPAPPATMEAAAKGVSAEAVITDATLLSVKKEAEAQAKACQAEVNKAAIGGVSTQGFDPARAASDPAYAQAMQQKLAAMSPQQQMAFAQQMQQAQMSAATSGSAMAAMEVKSLVPTIVGEQSEHNQPILVLTEGARQRAKKAHDLEMAAAHSTVTACPATKCGRTDCPLEPACVLKVGEASLVRHRAIATEELAANGKAYGLARQFDARLAELQEAADSARAEGAASRDLGEPDIVFFREATLRTTITEDAYKNAGIWASIPAKVLMRDELAQ